MNLTVAVMASVNNLVTPRSISRNLGESFREGSISMDCCQRNVTVGMSTPRVRVVKP